MLSTLIWLPVLGAAIIGFCPGTIPANRARLGALVVASSVVLWTIYLIIQFDLDNTGLQFQEYLPWNETLGLSYQLGVDGLSLLMVALNSLLTWIAIYSSSKQTERSRFFYALILLALFHHSGQNKINEY